MTSTATHIPALDLAGRFVAQSSAALDMVRGMQRASEQWAQATEPMRRAFATYADTYERLSASMAAVAAPMAWVGEAYREDTRRARRIARIRREALDLARGNEALAVEVRRLLGDLLAHSREYTAGLLAAALAEPDSEAVEHVREVAAEPGDLGRMARRVLAIIDDLAMLDARAERILHRAEVERVLSRSCMRRGPARRPCEERKEPPPAISVRGCIERNGPNRAPGAHAACHGRRPSRPLEGHVLRDAHSSGGPPT